MVLLNCSIGQAPSHTPYVGVNPWVLALRMLGGRLSDVVGYSHQKNEVAFISGIESLYARVESAGACEVESMREYSDAVLKEGPRRSVYLSSRQSLGAAQAVAQ